MTLGGPPVTILAAGGLPVTPTTTPGAVPFTVIAAGGMPITLADGAYPVSLLDEDGTPWSDAAHASDLLDGETQGLAIDFTLGSGLGEVAVIDTGTPANNKSNVPVDQFLTQSGTSPKLVMGADGLYHWSPHNLFVNSTSAPATQNVTLITGATYTYGVTGSGSLAGTSGASGTAVAATPVTFVATGTTGTFTVTGSLSTMWINRGSAQVLPYHATGAAAWFGVPIEYGGGGYYALVEPQATNLVLQNSTLGASWGLYSLTLVSDNVVAPTGVLDADTLTETGAPIGQHVIERAGVSIAAATVYTISGYVKRTAGARNFYFQLNITGGGAAGAFYDLDAVAAKVSSTLSGQTNKSATITSVGSGWYRCAFTFTSDAAAAATFTLYPGLTNDYAAEVRDYVGSTGAAMAMWGFQFELGSVATSPILTGAATVTRAADKLDFAVASFPYSSAAGMWYAEFTAYVTLQYHYLVSQVSGDVPHLFVLNNNLVGAYDLTNLVQTANAISANVKQKAAAAYGGTTQSAVLNAGTVATANYDGFFGGPADFGLGYGRNGGANQLTGRLHTVYYLPRRPTDAELQTRTTP